MFFDNFIIFAITKNNINQNQNEVMSNSLQSQQKIIMGHKLECQVCKHDKFWTRETLMNTPKMTFFKLDWANKTAQNYICDNCGYVHWFMKK